MRNFIPIGGNLFRASRIRRIESSDFDEKWRLHIYAEGYSIDERPELVEFETKDARDKAFNIADTLLNAS